MAADLLPLFPLKLVALPTSLIPLHIFEERYKEMVGIAIEQKMEFGIVLAQEGGIANIGCSVLVERVLQRYDDGRLDILCRGERRFEVVLVNTEKSYLRGSVYFIADESSAEPEPELEFLRQQAIDLWKRIAARVSADPLPAIDPDDPALSYRLGQAVADLNVRQILLQLRSETERLRHLLQFFTEVETRRGQAPRAKQGPSANDHTKYTNGNGRH